MKVIKFSNLNVTEICQQLKLCHILKKVAMAPLLHLSLSFGIFPNILKTSKITWIHKKHLKLKFLNYWPISLLTNIDKILESHV